METDRQFYKKYQYIALCCILLLPIMNVAQTSTNSPYSIYGLGVLQSKGFAQNMAMGDAKLGLASSNYINVSNPASYSTIDAPLFEVGMASNSLLLSTESLSQKTGNTFLKNIAIGLPVTEWWSTSFGIIPYSSMGYKITNQSIDSQLGTIDYLYEGKGGINQFFIGNAFTFINDSVERISIGFNASYLFGTLQKTNRVIPNSKASAFNTLIENSITIGDVYFDFGMQYEKVLKKGMNITIGGVWALSNQVNTTNILLAESYSGDIGFEIIKDTILDDNSTTPITIPHYLGFGFALEIKDKWTIALDGTMQDWNKNSFLNAESNLTRSRQLSFGVQYRHDKEAVNQFLKLVQYRLGLRYADTYLKVKGKQMSEYGISFGMGLPIMSSKSKTTFNISTELGQRGTQENGLIQEQFVNLYFGFSFAPHKFDRWFMKRKID